LMIYRSAIKKAVPIVVAGCRKSESMVQFGLRRFEICCFNTTKLNSMAQRPVEAAESRMRPMMQLILISESRIVRLANRL
jgi:hypothetical protein